MAVVTPEAVLAKDLSLTEHIRLLPGMPRGKKKAREKAEALCEAYGFSVDLTERAGNLSAGDRYRGEILLALLRNSEILVLCQPEAALTPLELETMAAGMRKACQQGKTVLMLTCRNHAAALADVRDVLSPAPDDTPPGRLDIAVGSVVLEARNITGNGLKDVSFEARTGEICNIRTKFMAR